MGERLVTNELVQLVEMHHAAVYRYAFRLTSSVTDAEDLTQQTYLVAQEKLSQLRDFSAARSWLFSILRHVFLKGLRKASPIPVSEPDLEAAAYGPPGPSLGEIDREALQGALGRLPEEFRLVVLMFYYEDRSYREIANELDVPIGTVMSRLSRAKQLLRKHLEREIAPPPIPLDRLAVTRSVATEG